MATMLHSESRRLYSWWWDSHISPKNSKWLQDNLTDMDAKVKSMIKLIEEDADSFARRAEMYYKKRPELMKLVEEFYRAYRALAERYDHATLELRHAHRTMAQAFPDQLPFSIGDEPQTPDQTAHPIRSFLDSDERGLKQLSEILNSRKGFSDCDSEVSNSDCDSETEVQSLKKTLAKVQAEKDTLLFQFQQNVEKLKNAERDLNQAKKDSGRLDEKASKAEIEIKILRESLSELEASRDAGLVRLEECLEKISNLDMLVSESEEKREREGKRADNAKTELMRLEAEKEAELARYRHCIEKISDLESKIAIAEESARSLNDQIARSTAEIEALKIALSEMTEEKDILALQCKQCAEIIAMMESEISRAQENTERLNGEILIGAAKLKSVEEQCVVLEGSNRNLKSEADDLSRKILMKDRELSEKNDELKKFQSLMIEESSKFQQVEATLQALQKIHSQSQEDQRSLALELEDGLRMLKDMEICRNGIEEEMVKVKDENRSLSEVNSSSALSLMNLQHEIVSLKEIKDKLEHEVSQKEDQSDSLQEEIGNLKEEMKCLNDRYHLITEQVESVGFTPETLESSVKELQDDNSKLKDERETLYEKVKDVAKLSTENDVLQNSLSGLNSELNNIREKAKSFQESCLFLEGEKSTLVSEKAALLSQLQMVTENMQKLFERNALLESSLSGANSELEQLRIRSKSLEEMCQMMTNEKSTLLTERSSLVTQLKTVEKRLGKLETRFTKLEEKYSELEKEKDLTSVQVENLRGSLLAEKSERSSYVQSTETRLTGLKNEVDALKEETRLGKKEFEEELDRAVNAQIEIFVLQKFIGDLEEKNFSLTVERQKQVEASKFSDKLISELESENLEQQVEAEFLVNEIEKLRIGIHLIFRALQFDHDHGLEKKVEQEQISVPCVLDNIEYLKVSVLKSEEGKQELAVENSVLLTLIDRLRENGAEIELEKLDLEQEFEIMKGHYRNLLNEKRELEDSNEHMRIEARESERRELELMAEFETLHEKMVNLQGSYLGLQEQNSKVLEENRLLCKKILDVKEEKSVLEEENDVILQEAVALSTFSFVLESFTAEKAEELEALSENFNALGEAKNGIEAEKRALRESLTKKEEENASLNDSIGEAKEMNDQLSLQLLIEKDFLDAKSSELSEAEERMAAADNLNRKLGQTVEELKSECEELRFRRKILADKIQDLTEESSNRDREVQSLREANGNLETEVGVLCEEVEKYRIREENLSSELEEKSNEFEIWESEASGFYFDLQISAVREVLLETKVHELIQACETLEDENSAKTMEIKQMKSKVGALESHVSKLEAKLSAYVPVVASLRENVASLERNARLKAKLLEASNRVKKVHRRKKSEELGLIDHSTEIPDTVADLQKMQNKIRAVEKSMMEEMESLTTESGEKAMEAEVKKLALQEKSRNPNNLRKTRADTGTLMKDIELDQISDFSLYGRSRVKPNGPNDQMLELWEENRCSSSSDADVAFFRKDLGIDEKKPLHSGKGKILERLASDAQKLTSLQRSVHELKRKMEAATSANGKHRAEFETVQMQILEVEEAVGQLAGVNCQLAKDLEGGPGPAGPATERARKGAERIGQLQFEVQNIHYLLLKLDGEGEIVNKPKARRFADSKTGVLLRDFIYSSRRRRQRRKKGCFCGCARPRAQED